MNPRLVLKDRDTGDVMFAGVPVSRSRPCPVCGKPDWCLYDAERGLTICPRTPNLRKIGDAGYLHGATPAVRMRVHRHHVAAYVPPRDFAPEQREYRDARFKRNRELVALAASLGVTAESLDRFRVGWSYEHNAWTFPMSLGGVDAGIRLRDSAGFKWAVPGSRNGLFIAWGYGGESPIYIEEGPTSAAALLDMGLYAIGRPSCSACVDATVAWCRGTPAVIVSNKDTPKQRADGSVFHPGQDGADKLAAAFVDAGRAVKVIEPLHGKDSRDWKLAGATRRTVEAVVDAVRFTPRRPA